jgi:Zn-dependent hydrolases, including glyoxylases
MKRKTFDVKGHDFKNWDEVFNNPQKITVRSFITGYVLLNKRGALNPDHPKAGVIEDEVLETPVLAHWVHHAQKGDYLIDTGLDSSYQDDPHGNMKGIFSKLFIKAELFVDEYKQGKRQNIGHYIEKNEIKLKGVFFTHLHSDHIAGTRELPKDILYAVNKDEKYHDYKPLFYGDYLKGVKILHEIDFKEASDMPVLGKCVDVFGDGSLWAVSTPGHTKGHVSFLINAEKCPVLIAGDVCFIKSSFRNGVAPSSYTEDVKVNQKSFDKIMEFKKIYPQVEVFCGHSLS